MASNTENHIYYKKKFTTLQNVLYLFVVKTFNKEISKSGEGVHVNVTKVIHQKFIFPMKSYSLCYKWQ